MSVDVGSGAERRVSEQFRHDRQILTLFEQQSRTRMAQVVEPLAGEACSRKGGLEPMGHVDPVERRADAGGEHEIRILPSAAGGETLLQLSDTMFSEAPHHSGRELQRSPRTVRLGLNERRLTSDLLQRVRTVRSPPSRSTSDGGPRRDHGVLRRVR